MTKCKDAFDIRVPVKRKYIRLNQSSFMNKEISKSIMNQLRLRNRFPITRSNGDKEVYNKQWNYCLSHRKVADNKSF